LLVSVITFLAPIVGCIYLFMKVKKLKKEIEKLQRKVAGLELKRVETFHENNSNRNTDLVSFSQKVRSVIFNQPYFIPFHPSILTLISG
jgi:hypothetical protein